jgi:hypothetical protein
LNGAVQAEGESTLDVTPTTSTESSDDSFTILTSDVLIDQRIDVYDQHEAQTLVRRAKLEAVRVSTNDEVFGRIDTIASAVGGNVETDRSDRSDVDDLDDLTLDQTWASGVDGIFGDWA